MFDDIIKKDRKSYRIALCIMDEDNIIAKEYFRSRLSSDVKKEHNSIFGLDIKEEIIDILKFELKADIDGDFQGIQTGDVVRKIVNKVI